MEKFLQDMLSAYWWISVVVVGIIINLISTYIRPFLENRLSRVSCYWKNRRDTRIELFNLQVSLIKANADLRSVYALREIRYRVRCVEYLVVSLSMSAMAIFARSIGILYGSAFLMFMGAISMLIAVIDHFNASHVQKLVESSIDSIDELKP